MKNSVQMLKKKTAELSQEFEVEEKKKREQRENQIRMLQASKKEVKHAKSVNTAEPHKKAAKKVATAVKE